MRSLIITMLLVFAPLAHTQYYTVVQEHSAAELQSLFQRAEQLQQQQPNELNPLVIILSGDELRLFNRKVYRDNKELIDWAARLSAFGAVDLRAVERELTFRHMEKSDVPTFLTLINGLEAELKTLTEQGYQAQ